jgi:hypothetical protein
MKGVPFLLGSLVESQLTFPSLLIAGASTCAVAVWIVGITSFLLGGNPCLSLLSRDLAVRGLLYVFFFSFFCC